MKISRNPVRLRFSMGYALVVGALVPALVLLFLDTRHQRWAIAVVAAAAVLALVTFRGRRLTGWVQTLFGWIWRRRRAPETASKAVVGATVLPGDPVAVRWQGETLVALIELIARPFTPTVIVDGQARSEDVLDTAMLEQLLAVHCPDLEADVVSAGYRIGSIASADVLSLYDDAVGSDPAPAHRRTWLLLRADPLRTRHSAQRRDVGAAGLARYLVASTTRIADRLAGVGIDARCCADFTDFDAATMISFERENWSRLRGPESVTAAFTAAGGPDVWWSAPADRTITRIRIGVGTAPRSTVLLTTAAKRKKPKGFAPLSGAQRAALDGQDLFGDRHWPVPIGSAGVMVGENPDGYRVYLPFDDVDSCVVVGEAQNPAWFAVRAAAAGGRVTLESPLGVLAEMIGADIGAVSQVVWPGAITHLGGQPGIGRVVLRDNQIATPRHQGLAVRPISLDGESRFVEALTQQPSAAHS
jgi:type VII secretion protein EccE